jgi:hypothetical protein
VEGLREDRDGCLCFSFLLVIEKGVARAISIGLPEGEHSFFFFFWPFSQIYDQPELINLVLTHRVIKPKTFQLDHLIVSQQPWLCAEQMGTFLYFLGRAACCIR